MIPPPIPLDEDARIAALEQTGWAKAAASADFLQWLEEMAASLDLPMVSVSLVDRRQQIPVAAAGFRARPCSREASLDGYVILDSDPLVVPDALKDERFADNPYVSGPPFIRFYAGTAIIAPGRKMVGAFAGMDTRPRHFPEAFFPQLQEAASEASHRLGLLCSAPAESAPAPDPAPAEAAKPPCLPALLEGIANGQTRDRLFFEELVDRYFKESPRLLQALEHPRDRLSAGRACEDLIELAQQVESTELASLCRAWQLDLFSKSPRRKVTIHDIRKAWDAGAQAIHKLRNDCAAGESAAKEVPA